MLKVILAAVLLVATSVSGSRTAPPPRPAQPQPGPMTVEHVAGRLFLVKGGAGANTAFFVGKKSVAVIDAKMTAEAAQKMLAEIKTIAALPVEKIILTHSDMDHVNGLTGFPPGIPLISSEGTKKEMAAALEVERRMPGSAPPLPGVTYSGFMAVNLAGGEKIYLLQLGPAHTSGDTAVVFPEEKTAFIGDLAFIGRDPLIHRQKGGTVLGYLAALKDLIALKGVETYLSGHADPLSKADLKTLLSTLEEKVAGVRAMIAAGKTLEQVKAALLPPPPAGAPPSRWPSFVEIAYLELTGK